MTPTLQILICLFFWFIFTGVLLRKSWRERESNSGLTLIYIVNLFLIHGFAGILYLLPWHRFIEGKWMVPGFIEATIGVSAFGVGSLFFAPNIIRSLSSSRTRITGSDGNKPKQESKSNLPRLYCLIGAIAYFILPPILIGYPTITALMGAGQQLMIAGICLVCWQAWQEKNMVRFKRWFALSFTLPFISIMFHGYLGAGVVMSLTVLFFVIRFFKLNYKTVIIGVVLAYLGFSLYLTYMRDRDQLRTAIWGTRIGLSQRVNVLKTTLSRPIWFNIFNLEHLEGIDNRMNQNILVGAAVDYINLKGIDYAHGATLWDSIIALIPRAVWAEKYIVAGSPGIVTKYTGIPMSEAASVGVGQVMEFYINFGRIGVIFGFLVLGIFIAIIDIRAGYYLKEGNLKKFLHWFLPGLAFLNVGGSFVEVSASAGAAIFTVYLVTSRNILILLLISYFAIEVAVRFLMRFVHF